MNSKEEYDFYILAEYDKNKNHLPAGFVTWEFMDDFSISNKITKSNSYNSYCADTIFYKQISLSINYDVFDESI